MIVRYRASTKLQQIRDTTTTATNVKSCRGKYGLVMSAEYLQAALSKATWEIIEDEEPFYGEVPELRGVWAIGKTLEKRRENLKGVIEGWIALRLRLGLAIPPINGHTIEIPSRAEVII